MSSVLKLQQQAAEQEWLAHWKHGPSECAGQSKRCKSVTPLQILNYKTPRERQSICVIFGALARLCFYSGGTMAAVAGWIVPSVCRLNMPTISN